MKYMLPLLALSLVGCSATTSTSKKAPDVVLARRDTEVAEAAQRARDDLPKFLERLKSPKPSEKFAVNANFGYHGNFEHMWVDHLTYDGAALHGKLADQPVLIKEMHKGDQVQISTQQVYDWLIKSDGKIEGGYVQQVLHKKAGS